MPLKGKAFGAQRRPYMRQPLFLLPIPYCLLPIPYSLLPIAYCLGLPAPSRWKQSTGLFPGRSMSLLPIA